MYSREFERVITIIKRYPAHFDPKYGEQRAFLLSDGGCAYPADSFVPFHRFAS